MNKKLIFPIIFMLLMVFPAQADWEPISSIKEYYRVGNSANFGSINVKVIDIDVEGRTADVIITTTQGNKLYEGVLTKSIGHEKAGSLRVLAGDFRYYDTFNSNDKTNPEIKINVDEWVGGDISDINFPEEIYKFDAYKVYGLITNKGPHTSTFIVEMISKGGNFNVREASDQVSVKYRSKTKERQTSASQEVTLQPKESKKIYFEIQPRVQPSPEAGEVISAKIRLLTASGLLVDEVDIEPSVIVADLTGFIEDIYAPTAIYSGDEGFITVIYRNSWIGGSNNYVMKLIAPEFRVHGETKVFTALSQMSTPVDFRVLPFGGGDFSIAAELSVGHKVVDTHSVDIKVIGDKIYKIKSVDAPKRMKRGETGVISVVVMNDGPTVNTMSLAVESDDFKIENPEAVLKLNSGEETNVVYNMEALKSSGSSYFTVKLFDPPEKHFTNLYNKQYKLVDSKTFRVDMGKKEVSVPKKKEELEEVVEEVVEEVETVVEEVVEETVTEEIAEKDEVSSVAIDIQDYWPYIAIGLLVIFAIILITKGEKRRKKKSSTVEVYNLEKEMLDDSKKKKKKK